MKTKRRMTKAERENRDGMMRKIEWARILVMRSLIEAGWSNRRLANTWATLESETARLVISHSVPDHNWCCEAEVAQIVKEAMLSITFTPWDEVIR